EQVVEDVRHGGGEVRTEAAAAVAIEGRVAHVVVGTALLRVLQDLVGLVQLLELLLGRLVAAVAVGMAILCQAAERRLDVLVARPSREPQNLVVVTLGHEPGIQSSPSLCGRRAPGAGTQSPRPTGSANKLHRSAEGPHSRTSPKVRLTPTSSC